jgi:hypothetical protein
MGQTLVAKLVMVGTQVGDVVVDGVSLDNNCIGMKAVGTDVGCVVGTWGPCKGISLEPEGVSLAIL